MRLRTTLAALALLALPAAPRAEETPPACESGTALAPGLCLAGTLTGDAMANVSGGIRRGAAAVGQLRLDLTADLGTLAGLDGWRMAASAFAIYGRQPTATRVGSLAPVSNIEALSTVRLFEFWAERSLGEWGSLRFGQLAADAEFAAASGAANLVNGTFGWPVALAGALPSGGPAYPLATPGIRLALGDPEGATGLRLGVFSGDPGGAYGEGTDPQRHNRYGTLFSTRGGAFYLAEAVTGGEAPEGEDAPRPWVLKLGGWYHTGGFDSVRFDDAGLSLADPASSGTPRRFGNNYGGYAVAEATLWRGEEGWVSVFGRAFAQPGDRNAVDLQLDGGLAWRGPFGRGGDTLSLGVSWARIGARSRDFDRDLIAFGTTRPVRSHETVVELNYDAVVIEDRLSLRPLAQLLFNPAAGEPDERRDRTRALPDAVVLGMRAVLTF
ncbi:carbohydrate porin [Roseomonas sp. PWR1]|uniref:Carbohydrate porin n=1 Tax=Roseomonas nitratireducens TaxID=2820810 RepID=A0ABS4AY56_9PROT|nr:carbohydrate porin [Neoroseomonas nitratireducens]MBP0466314.1 carbohydrate porin [Neoroseomonas nitratireducens]